MQSLRLARLRPLLSRPLSTRAHPLANRASPRGPLPTSPFPKPKGPAQQWSTLTAILLATLTGSLTYVVGIKSRTEREGKAPDPTSKGFESALKEVKEFLPEDCWSVDRDDLISHGHSDWSSHDSTGLPGVVLYPRNTEDVVKIVKVASHYSIPLIPYSGGTSLEGHVSAPGHFSNPAEKAITAKVQKGERVEVEELVPGLAFSLDFAENMNQVVAIHADDLDAVVQPGVGYDFLNSSLKEQGIPLFFPVDPAPGAQIGGMIGTGASGTNAVRYGTMRDNVINLTVVLPNGEIVKTRQRAKKSSVGPDLGKLFVGSEGTLGIVVEATLKLSPLLPTTVAVSSFPTVKDAANAVREIVQGGIGVACIEMCDDVMVKCMNKASGGSGRVWEEKPSLFVKFTGTEGQMKSDVQRTKQIMKSNAGSSFTFARNPREAEEIWYSRKVALWSALDYRPGSKCWVTDVCVPISEFPTLIAETRADLEKEGILGPICSHAGDGNFHSLLLYRTDEELEKVKGLVHRMVDRAQRLDGTCTGEHGVGLGKRDYIEAELGRTTIDLLRKIKKVIDPKNIMNPSKLLPEE